MPGGVYDKQALFDLYEKKDTSIVFFEDVRTSTECK